MLGSQITRALTITEKGLWSFLILAQMLALTNGKAAGGTKNCQIVEKRFTEMIIEKHNSGEMSTYLINVELKCLLHFLHKYFL